METEKFMAMLKKQLESQINEEYTEYKNKKLQDLNIDLEMKRNEIVKDILNSVNILGQETPMGLQIMIKVENRIIQPK